ncbi:helix-turn-helix transcriptional regulator [Promicromonospora sp. NPDC057488]|uniref:helix-turn-helix transcriptional regulator n=1 Tax=Promicromonospora sp. NPDC057488 TaxID=3346147 RepID=UPI00366B20EA
MTPRSGDGGPPPLRTPSSVRTVRPDGTPVYRYQPRLGMPPVNVNLHDGADEHPHPPPGHRHAHDFYVLVLIERGTRGDDGAHDGDLFAVPPGRTIDPGTVQGFAGSRAWTLAFTPDAVPSLASVSPLAWAHHPLLALFEAEPAGPGAADRPPALSANVPADERPRWSAWLTELHEELAGPGRLGARDAASALLTRILIGAARLAPSAPAPPDPLVTRVFDEIESTFRDPVSAADVAGALGYTPGYLTTAVRERTGRTLLEWITERRMTEVRRMLRDTDLPLAVVAARTGLRDATYLVRRFKDRYGITPDRWRRTERA